MKEWRNKKKRKKENKIEKERMGKRKKKIEIMNTNPWCRLGPRVWLDQGTSKRTGY